MNKDWEMELPRLETAERERTPCMGREVFTVEEDPPSRTRQLISFWKLGLLAWPWVGIQAIWQAEFSATKPYLEELGLSEFGISNIWISGPVMGFFVAPLVGAFSDATTSVLGRRRPWMLWGLVFLGVVSLILASSSNFYEETHKALPIALLMFVILDGAINVVQTPTRAFLADLAPANAQVSGQMLASAFQGLGTLVGIGIQKALYTDPADVFWLFTTVFFMNLIVFLPICAYVTEQPIKKRKTDAKTSLCTPILEVKNQAFSLSKAAYKVSAVQFFSWVGMFCFSRIGPTWMGAVVFEGCSTLGNCTQSQVDWNAFREGENYLRELETYSAVLQLGFSLALAAYIVFASPARTRFFFAAGLFAGGVACFLGLGSSKLVRNDLPWIGETVVMLYTIAVSVITAFPFGLIGKYRKEKGEKDTGVHFGILNLFIVVPQIITTLVVNLIKTQVHDLIISSNFILGIGGGCFLLAASIACFLDE